MLEGDLNEQDWNEVEADFSCRLLSGHEQPVTLREVRELSAHVVGRGERGACLGDAEHEDSP